MLIDKTYLDKITKRLGFLITQKNVRTFERDIGINKLILLVEIQEILDEYYILSISDISLYNPELDTDNELEEETIYIMNGLNEILKEFNKNELEFYLDSLSNKHKKEYLKSIN